MGVLITAWLDVRSKPLRTFAAIAGMIAAVMAVVIVDAAAVLSRQANDEYISRTWGRSATVQIFPADGAMTMSPDAAAAAGDQLVTALVDNGVTRVSTYVEVGMALVHGEQAIPLQVSWVSSTYPDVSFVDLVAGSFPQETAQSDTLHVVITLDTARQLGFAGADAVGATISYALAEGFVPDLRTTMLQPMVIDAVARSLGTATSANSALVVSDHDQPTFLRRGAKTWRVHVNPTDVALVEGVVHGFRAENADTPIYDVRRVDQGRELAPVLSQQEVTASAVTVVALSVGGLGSLGVGLASVRERSKDFGLRRALGASKGRVFAGVIVQTLLEVLLAALIAIPVSAIAVELFARQLVLESLPLPSATALPIGSAIRGLVAALLVGLIAGLLPAFHAARLSVVQALRG
jgi:putative ABC transport system permease protein